MQQRLKRWEKYYKNCMQIQSLGKKYNLPKMAHKEKG